MVFLLAALAARPAPAHVPAYGVGTVSTVTFDEEAIRVTFDLSYDGYWAQSEMIGMDADHDLAIDKEEADAYILRQWERKITPQLHARLDGVEVPIHRTGQRHDGLVGEIYPAPFSLYYDLEVRPPKDRFLPGKEYVLELEDTVTRDETPAKPRFTVPYPTHGPSAEFRLRIEIVRPASPVLDTSAYILEGSDVRLKFRFEPAGGGSAAPPAGKASASPPAASTGPARPAAPAGPAGRGLEAVLRQKGELSTYEILACVLLAILAGAGHALAPGHGKAMVAAYLIGSRGRVRDAVTLGLTTTITHTGSVFLFGAALFLLVSQSTRASEAALQNRVVAAAQLLSGVLLFILGLALFLRRARSRGHGGEHPHEHPHGHPHTDGQPHSHPHAHHHPHDHPHGGGPSGGADAARGLADGAVPRLRDLLALGISGGLVPCPAGLTVILVGLHFPDKLLFAIFLLIFFSLGLGGVLVAIGVALITGKTLAQARSQGGAVFSEAGPLRRVFPRRILRLLDRYGPGALKVLPALSALFIAALGIFFCVTTVLTSRVEIAAMLRALANLLQ